MSISFAFVDGSFVDGKFGPNCGPNWLIQKMESTRGPKTWTQLRTQLWTQLRTQLWTQSWTQFSFVFKHTILYYRN